MNPMHSGQRDRKFVLIPTRPLRHVWPEVVMENHTHTHGKSHCRNVVVDTFRLSMAIWVVKFSSRGYKNWKDLGLKINIQKGNYRILRIGLMGKCQTPYPSALDF